MPLRDDTGPLNDRWTRVEADALLTDAPILAFEDASARDDLPETFALHVENDVDLDALTPWLDRAALISVNFPSFADGRGFSVARALRARGYQGRLRAFGPVIADQYAYLRACGFDEVETPEKVANRQPEAHWAEAQDRMTLRYQKGYPGPQNILEARRAARGQ